MAALTSGGAVVDGSSLVPYYVSLESQPDIAVLSQGELFQKELMFNQRSFYPHLVQDLNQAASTVVVISPYMSTRRVAQLLPHFQSLLSRGVNIKIFTKPPREQLSRQQEVEELHRHLTRMGIAVYQQYGTHEKVVAIDGQISYQGSLNTLSHSSTKEMMIRTDSPLRLQKMFSVLANNHPQLRDCLTGIGYTPEDVVDLAPEKLLNIVDSVRPKRRGLPSTPSEAREYYSTMFTKLRWVIADDKRIPNFAVLFGKTVAAMLETAPETVEDLLELPEFHRNRSNVRGYESIILEILSEYRRLIAAGEGLRPRLLACPWPSP